MITYDVHVLIGRDNPDKHISVKSGDTGVNLRVFPEVLHKAKWSEINEAYSIPAGSTAILRISKSDRTYVVIDGAVGVDSVLFSMPGQSFTAPGDANAEVSLYSAEGKRLTTATFTLEVLKECVSAGDIESAGYFDILSEQIAGAKDAQRDAEDAKDAAEAARDLSKEYAENAGKSAEAAAKSEQAAKDAETAAKNAETGATSQATAAEASKTAAEESAREAALSVLGGGYVSFQIREDGKLYCGRTRNLVETLNFRLNSKGQLEVLVSG